MATDFGAMPAFLPKTTPMVSIQLLDDNFEPVINQTLMIVFHGDHAGWTGRANTDEVGKANFYCEPTREGSIYLNGFALFKGLITNNSTFYVNSSSLRQKNSSLADETMKNLPSQDENLFELDLL
ncbi:MAG: hypothetical protein AAGA62_00765 [Bacteroidota bacterium]